MKTTPYPLPFYRKHPRWTLLGINLVLIFVILLVTEVVLRAQGEVPGYMGPRPWEYVDITRVDSLVVDQDFVTGSDGIFRADPAQFVDHIQFQVNSEGFRDDEFEELDTSRTQLLFIGDSFTWGASADPVSECFVDRVEREGYACINLGIPGTEPNQYALVAEKYVPRFRPDMVCVMFFMGNDIMYEKIELKPFQHKYHLTNAGWLNPYLDGDYMPTAQETYDYYLAKYSVPNTDQKPLNRFLASTVLGTKFWMGLNMILKEEAKIVQERKAGRQRKWHEEPVSYDYLMEIKNTCEQYEVPVLFFVLPEKGFPTPRIPGDYPDVFRDLPVHCPTNLKETDFNPFPDSHYNNEGHQKYAEFILSVLSLQSEMQPTGATTR